MSYYINRRLRLSFDETISHVKIALGEQGFGILTEIDVQSVLKAKLGADFRRYRILGVCNPPLAHQALEAEDKIGTMLPCNLIVQEHAPGDVEVAAINPVTSMAAINNPALGSLAATVRDKLEEVLASL
jgi:uncharacterized protein (DUF302 family)